MRPLRPALLLLLLPLPATLLLAACPELPVEVECSNDLDCADGQLCREAACVVPDDPCAPFLSCGGGCVDPSTSSVNCGSCGNECGEGVSCAGGACCPAGTPVVCGGSCTDVSTSPLHCGSCGAPCDEGLVCSGGSCCPAGTELCDGYCRTIATDPYSCGGCGVRCPQGAACADGTCKPCPEGTADTACGTIRACMAPEHAGPPCMVEIPAGPFTRGVDVVGADFAPASRISLRAFLLDLLETSQLEWKGCVDAGACGVPEIFDPARTPDLPVTWLTWHEADAYCRWRGGRLPSEAEWEKAARGELAEWRNFPWGNNPVDCVNASHFACDLDQLPGGSYPYGASPYGILDLAGNVSEWVADWYAADAYSTGPSDDPTGPATGTQRVERGGNAHSGPSELATTARGHRPPEDFHAFSGVRCARDP